LIKKLQRLNNEDEILVSFDVESLFPSVPLEPTLNTIKHHVSRQNIPKSKKEFLIKAVELCMETNQFQFRGKFFKQKSGLPIGSSLSPQLASFFMLHFENRIKRNSWFPRFYVLYVDDILAVVTKMWACGRPRFWNSIV
jgi:retron-type reverse transcriptase